MTPTKEFWVDVQTHWQATWEEGTNRRGLFALNLPTGVLAGTLPADVFYFQSI
ncbi:MAG: hypothetical protein KDB27_00995 [Planctomycetales bacterium]|nr:hypothetical protein [Planctomycetales bacterium]